MIDEDPSDEDVARFSGETAFCPECGAEVWDQAEVCPECSAYLGGDTSNRHPVAKWFREKWIILLVIVTLIGLLLATL